MAQTTDLDAVRRSYAEDIGRRAGVRSAAVLEALSEVPRERFLGPGPWTVISHSPGKPDPPQLTPDDDPSQVYRDISVALNVKRNLYNGAPSIVAGWIDALELGQGDRVFHLRGASGYYTAIMARIVGPKGHVLMAEIDEQLVSAALEALRDSNLEIVIADGGLHDPGPCDAMLVNAGVTHPSPLWLERLNDGGRLLVPLTFEFPNSNLGKGAMFKITKQGGAFMARFVPGTAPLLIFSCSSVRDAALNEQLLTAFTKGLQRVGEVRSLRLDRHDADSGCWLHTDTICLSFVPVSPLDAR